MRGGIDEDVSKVDRARLEKLSYIPLKASHVVMRRFFRGKLTSPKKQSVGCSIAGVGLRGYVRVVAPFCFARRIAVFALGLPAGVLALLRGFRANTGRSGGSGRDFTFLHLGWPAVWAGSGSARWGYAFTFFSCLNHRDKH